MEFTPIRTGNAIPTIETAEELETLLEGSDAEDQDEDAEEEGESQGDEKQKAPVQKKEPKKEQQPEKQQKAEEKKEKSIFNQEDPSVKKKEEDAEEEEEEPDEDKHYSSMIEYLNEKHALNLNLKELPPDLSREQEAEVISNILHRMTQGVNHALAQYSQIEQLLQDDEVRIVLQAKSQGKSLKDITAEYQKTIQGMSSDELVADDFKKRYPTVKPEIIAKMVDSAKKSGEFDEIAESIREARKAEEIESAKHRIELDKQQLAAKEQERQQNIHEFQQKLGAVKNVYGIPLDDQMRAEIFAAATQRNEQGLTYLDEALQSDEGILLATLGLLHLEKLINAKASIKANKRTKNFMDRVFDTAERLQSSSGKGKTDDDTDIELINRF